MSIYISNYLNKLEQDLGNSISRGDDILRLTSSKQLNLFILKNIYDNWTLSFEKNKSNYFNYENDDILGKIDSLQNILSNHIHIKFDDLRILLKKSIIDLVEYIYDPSIFLKNDLIREKNLNDLILNRKSKFYIANKEVFKSLTEKIRSKDLTFRQIGVVIDTFSFEKNQKLIDELKLILDCEESDLKAFYVDPLNYDELFNVSEDEVQEIINIAKNKKSFIIAAEFILENVDQKLYSDTDEEKIRALLREIKESFI